MRPFWHPLSAVFLIDPEAYATPRVVRMFLGAGPIEVRYAGDRMAFALRHGHRVVVERVPEGALRRGDVLLACPNGIVDLLRVERIEPGRLVVAADADPGFAATLAAEEILGRARAPRKRVRAAGRRLRRMLLDLVEARTGRPDGEGDPAETVRTKYDAQAADYAGLATPEIEEPLLARLRSSVPAGGRILVAGSGSGRECFALARAGWRVEGVDFSPAMVALARAEAARRGVPINFRIADLRTHEEPAGSLDAVVFTYDVYSFLPQRGARVDLVRRMLAWLTPTGVLFPSARRTSSLRDRIVLTIERFATRGPGSTWGASHTRWLTSDGRLRRSFVQLFTERSFAAEVREAGGTAEPWIGGHALVRRRGSA